MRMDARPFYTKQIIEGSDNEYLDGKIKVEARRLNTVNRRAVNKDFLFWKHRMRRAARALNDAQLEEENGGGGGVCRSKGMFEFKADFNSKCLWNNSVLRGAEVKN